MPLKKRDLRGRYFTDRAVQGALLLHVIGNWLMFLLTVGVFLLLVEFLQGGPGDALQGTLRRYTPCIWATVVLAPIFLWDLVRLTHRFAGPMVRLRREMHNLANGRQVAPLHFRDRDFWKELATDFNRIAERVQAPTASDGQEPETVECHHHDG